MNIQCYFNHQACPKQSLKKQTLIAIDVLRATSSIITALNNGAKEIIAVKNIANAKALKAQNPQALLVGERSGDIIPGFDIGNSPFDFPADLVKNKTIISCTTNGTAAIEMAQNVKNLWIGAIINCQAVAQKTIAENVEDLVVLCSGTEGKISLDDILGGGSIIYHINQLSCGQNQANQMNDAAFIAQSMYLQFRDDLEKGLHQAAHGRKLTSMGRGKDLHYCSQEAIIAAVPEMVQGKLVLK